MKFDCRTDYLYFRLLFWSCTICTGARFYSIHAESWKRNLNRIAEDANFSSFSIMIDYICLLRKTFLCKIKVKYVTMPLQTRHKCFFYCVNIECLNGKKFRVFLLKQIRWWLKFRVFYSPRKLKSNKKLTTFADRNEQKKHTHTDEKESPEKLLTFFFIDDYNLLCITNPNLNAEKHEDQSRKKATRRERNWLQTFA